MQAIEYDGEAPKPNRDLMYGGEEFREDLGKEEREEITTDDTTAGKWTTQKEKIGAELGASWTGVNISMNELTGRSWIASVAQAGVIKKYNLEIQENSYLRENVKDVLVRACKKSGFNLKIVQTQKRENVH